MKSEYEVADYLQSKLKKTPSTALVLGSGWNRVVEDVDVLQKLKFEDVFGVEAGVAGHKGELILGEAGDKYVLFICGRFHTYECYSSYEVTLPIRVFARLGIKNLVITSAAGGLNPKYKVGDIVVLEDMITLLSQSPLTGSQFQDLSSPFDPELKKAALNICQSQKIPHQKGVYMYLRGPHYETFADKKACLNMGADVVGMSTVPETIMANRLGVKVLGLSCVTNLAFVKHSHTDVIKAAENVSTSMVKLLQGIIKNIK
jgi:purine-nucleoside phosphorylase